MSLLSAMIEANEEAFGLADRFHYESLTMFNSYVDKFEPSDFPANLVLPYTLNGIHKPPFVESTAVIRGYILRRITEDTNDWRAIDVEVNYIEPMRQLARAFVGRMLVKEMVDQSGKRNATSSINPEYMFLHPHLFGVLYTLNLPVIERLC